MQEDEDAPATQLVEMLTSRSMRRRSSMSVTPSDASPSNAAAPGRDVVTPPTLMAGDKSSRPHFLKERSATMRSRVSITSLSPASAYGSQSKASAFLLGLVERSHSSPSHFEPKATPQQPVVEMAPRSSTQRRSGTMIEPMEPPQESATGRRKSILHVEPPSGLLGMLQSQNSSSSLLPAHRSLVSVRSGLASLEPHNEDEQEYVREAELREKPLKELVRDLGLCAKKQATLLRILNEIHRRLQDAEMDVGHGPTHLPMCREIVDDGVLKFVAQAMREFRFDVSLQMAAISLLSFLADISDLYAFMMAELDVEPLVQKVVGDHVSQERLVMNGSTLFHAINESKRKSHVAKEHKARQAEMEKRKRTESFSHVFAAGLNSSKPKLSVKTIVEDRRLNDLHRPGSRWQRNALSASLGAPPLLTAHYDLEVTSTARRPSAIPPLERVPSSTDGDEEDPLRLDDGFPGSRPVTSPEPHSSSLTSRFRSLTSPSTAHVAAIYSKSPMFVAPSPLAERMSVRRTQSATALKRKSTKRRGHAPESRARQLPPQAFTPRVALEDEEHSESHRSEELSAQNADDEEAEQADDVPSRENNEVDGSQHEEEQNNKDEGSQREVEPGDDDDDPAYDDDFANDDEEEHSIANEPELQENQGRLLPVGSDSELMELVENPDQRDQLQQQNESPREDMISSAVGLVEVNSDSELVAMIESCNSELASMDLKIEDDPVTSELVGLLSSCVDSDNPTARPSPGLDSQSRLTPSTPKLKKKKKHAPCSPSVSAWVPPTTIVRPVSRRIMDKTAKTTKHTTARAPRLSTGSRSRPSSGATTAQITTILDKINPHHEDEDETASPTPEQEIESHSAGFAHVPEPCSTPTASISQIQALYARGLQHHKADELDAAIRCYEAGIKLQHSSGVDREFASLYINLGSAKMTQHKLSDALAAFTHAERIQPQNTKAVFNCGLVLMQLERWGDAQAKLACVVATDTSHLRAKVALEQCEHAMRR